MSRASFFFVPIKMVADIGNIQVFKLVPVIVDFVFKIETAVYVNSLSAMGEHIVHLNKSVICKFKHLMDMHILLVGEVVFSIKLVLR